MDRLPLARAESVGKRRAAARRPTVSVCIVNWNCRELLRACLASLHTGGRQPRLEVIVIDNGSTDGAADMVEHDFPRVRLVRNCRNVGFARANNQAARLARGRWLFFLNNDTEVPPLALRRLIAFARANPGVGIIGPRLCTPGGRAQVSCRRRPTLAALLHHTWLLRWTGLFRRAYRRYRSRGGDLQTTQPVEAVLGAALLVRRRLLLRYGLWDEGYPFGVEDVEMCLRIGRDHPVVYHPAVTIVHHGRVSSRQRPGYVHINWLLGMARFLRQNGTPAALLALYKIALTLDAPAQLARHLGQYLWRQLGGRKLKAARSWLHVRAAAHFLTRGVLKLWRH